MPAQRRRAFGAGATCAISLVCIGCLLLLTGLVLVGHHGGGPVQGWDDTVQRWAVHHRSGLVGVSRLIDTFGQPFALFVIAFGLSLWLVDLSRQLAGTAPLVGYIGAEVMALATGHLVARPRPPTADYPAPGSVPNLHATGYSFPSGHATAGVAVVLSVAAVLSIGRPAGWRWPVAMVACVGIGASRVLLGVNWFSDVVVGMAAGAAWAAVAIRSLSGFALPAWVLETGPRKALAHSVRRADERPRPAAALAGERPVAVAARRTGSGALSRTAAGPAVRLRPWRQYERHDGEITELLPRRRVLLGADGLDAEPCPPRPPD